MKSASSPASGAGKRRRASRRRRRKPIDFEALRNEKKLVPVPFYQMGITDFYKPLKKPVTIRVDMDVIAWFKKGGKRYQTRMNLALRRAMEQEMKKS
jgi:uncharacterized protein (DUF4415 family)